MILHSAIKEALATHEALRRLGFLPEEIFVNVKSPPQIFVTIQRDDKEFNILVSHDFDATPDIFIKHWCAAAEAWNGTMKESERREIWQNSIVRRSAVGLVTTLLARGFTLARQDLN